MSYKRQAAFVQENVIKKIEAVFVQENVIKKTEAVFIQENVIKKTEAASILLSVWNIFCSTYKLHTNFPKVEECGEVGRHVFASRTTFNLLPVFMK